MWLHEWLRWSTDAAMDIYQNHKEETACLIPMRAETGTKRMPVAHGTSQYDCTNPCWAGLSNYEVEIGTAALARQYSNSAALLSHHSGHCELPCCVENHAAALAASGE